MAIYPKLILDALATVRYPGNGKDLVAAGMVEDDIRIEGNKVSFSLIFERANDPFQKSVVKAAETAILTYVGEEVDIKGNIRVKSRQAQAPAAYRGADHGRDRQRDDARIRHRRQRHKAQISHQQLPSHSPLCCS